MKKSMVFIIAGFVLSCAATFAATVDVYTWNGTAWGRSARLGSAADYVQVTDYTPNRTVGATPYFTACFAALTSGGIEFHGLSGGVWTKRTVTTDPDWIWLDTDGKARRLMVIRPNGDLYSYYTEYHVTWNRGLVKAGNGYTQVTAEETNVNDDYAAGTGGVDRVLIDSGVTKFTSTVFTRLEGDRCTYLQSWGLRADGIANGLYLISNQGAGRRTTNVYWDIDPDYTVWGTYAANANGVDLVTINVPGGYTTVITKTTTMVFTDIAAEPGRQAFYGVNSHGVYHVFKSGSTWMVEQVTDEGYAHVAADSRTQGIVYAYDYIPKPGTRIVLR